MPDASSGFAHITVTAGEQGERVYRVGPSAAAAPVSTPASASASASTSTPASAPVAEIESVDSIDSLAGIEPMANAEPVVDAEPVIGAEPVDDTEAQASFEAPASVSVREPAQGVEGDQACEQKMSKRKSREYRETTLEDLDRTPMSLTQKIVLICAFALLVGFVLYYTLFM